MRREMLGISGVAGMQEPREPSVPCLWLPLAVKLHMMSPSLHATAAATTATTFLSTNSPLNLATCKVLPC